MQVDPLRRFYSSLHEQIPDSDMAKKWCGLAPAFVPLVTILLTGIAA